MAGILVLFASSLDRRPCCCRTEVLVPDTSGEKGMCTACLAGQSTAAPATVTGEVIHCHWFRKELGRPDDHQGYP